LLERVVGQRGAQIGRLRAPRAGDLTPLSPADTRAEVEQREALAA